MPIWVDTPKQQRIQAGWTSTTGESSMASELERDKFGIRGEGVTHQGAPSSGQQGTGPFAETVAKSPRWGKAKLVRDCLAV